MGQTMSTLSNPRWTHGNCTTAMESHHINILQIGMVLLKSNLKWQGCIADSLRFLGCQKHAGSCPAETRQLQMSQLWLVVRSCLILQFSWALRFILNIAWLIDGHRIGIRLLQFTEPWKEKDKLWLVEQSHSVDSTHFLSSSMWYYISEYKRRHLQELASRNQCLLPWVPVLYGQMQLCHHPAQYKINKNVSR